MGEATYKLQCAVDMQTLAKIDKVAEHNGLERTSAQRFLMNYALRNMPVEMSGVIPTVTAENGEEIIIKHDVVDIKCLPESVRYSLAASLVNALGDDVEINDKVHERIENLLGIHFVKGSIKIEGGL
jgi:hypothetical protein